MHSPHTASYITETTDEFVALLVPNSFLFSSQTLAEKQKTYIDEIPYTSAAFFLAVRVRAPRHNPKFILMGAEWSMRLTPLIFYFHETLVSYSEYVAENIASSQ